eukprot:COSAG01_NODE_808_length_13418_cov_9.469631_5_plen_246_part_00
MRIDKIMDPKAAGAYVLMSNTGWTGRFNRAQRGAFNTDESLPCASAHHLCSRSRIMRLKWGCCCCCYMQRGVMAVTCRLFLANVLLAGMVYGPVVVALVLLAVYGRYVARAHSVHAQPRIAIPSFRCFRVLSKYPSRLPSHARLPNRHHCVDCVTLCCGFYFETAALFAHRVTFALLCKCWPLIYCADCLSPRRAFDLQSIFAADTEGTDKRGAGFLPAIVGERWTGGLVLFTAIKVLAGDRIPF